MDVFKLKNEIINNYHTYVESFLNIKDTRLREYVKQELSRGVLWPDALVQLSPSYEMGKTVSELVSEGLLHPLCEKIFKKNGHSFRLYDHQEQAIRIAAKNKPYVLTTGTGSGKSLTFLIPIIDHILKTDTQAEKVRALIVYPLNALINSQSNEIKTLLNNLEENQDIIRFAQYTGQERGKERQRLQEHPPQLLLTNYVMLELMMSRPKERVFVDRALANLEFLVIDELHTYTGRQGADVSLLLRRVRERSGNKNLLCIGTSATMVVGGTRQEQRKAVSKITSKIFGTSVSEKNIIDERLKRNIKYNGELSKEVLSDALKSQPPSHLESFVANPLSAWIEETFGIEKKEDTYNRRTPTTLLEGTKKLNEKTGIDIETCQEAIAKMLLTGNKLKTFDGNPVFGVRLHQFISQGDAVYGTIEPSDSREFTLSAQHWAESKDNKNRLLIPFRFCRICGQEYYEVTLDKNNNTVKPKMPEYEDAYDDEYMVDGYLFLEREEDPIWSEGRIEELPENWFRTTQSGMTLNRNYKEFLPVKLYVAQDGKYSTNQEDNFCTSWFLKSPFLFCPNCGTAYDKRTKDYSKLARLSSEGRSTATTLLSLSEVVKMQEDPDVPKDAQKVLSFSDNRQDASLQAGHFNDFIQVGLLRSAIYKALPDNGYLDHAKIAISVVEALNLSQSSCAKNPGEFGVLPKRNKEALIAYVEYRIYQDLRRGWRILQPNLEQCGLLMIEYEGLEDVCKRADLWDNNSILSETSPENRFRVMKAFLNHLRRSLAIDAECLQGIKQLSLIRQVNQILKEPWTFDDDERLAEGRWFAWGERQYGDFSLSPISVLGKFLRSSRAWPELPKKLRPEDYKNLLRDLVKVLNQAGYIAIEENGDNFRIQLQIDSMHWVRGEGRMEPDPVRLMRLRSATDESLMREANKYFSDFYKSEAETLAHLEAREHTGQTSREDRDDREKRFRAGDLSCLFCSPTMELGIDIADLNVVHLRNVPPTPANYAQRSGRAGRSGQPALITSYCSMWSGHDQYFFQRQPEIVAGVVVPPRLDLENEELIKSHMHAIWLGHVGLDLEDSILELIDLNQEDFPLDADVSHQISLSENRIKDCIKECKAVLEQCEDDLQNAPWYTEEWIENVVRSSPQEFNEAFDRWRELYRIADSQLAEAQDMIKNAHRKRLDKREVEAARKREKEALRQRELLSNRVTSRDDSDFYPYRYLATEGFLPGYNFPRLPVRAYISKGIERDTFLARHRFLAVSEYGPRNIIYHEGRKYRVFKSFLPPGDPESRFIEVKLCNMCGTFHTGDDLNVDICDHCKTPLNASTSEYLKHLFEMTTVGTQRAERITCDEEERVRRGYEITTQYRFSKYEGKERKYSADVLDEKGSSLLKLEYGPAAQLWRINRRWRRSRESGYTLDLNTGAWNKRKNDFEDTALDVGTENIKTGVQLFVRDTRNILLINTSEGANLSDDVLANLQHAIHLGLSALFQVDYNEISSDRIGEGEMRSILFWEAAEGGVGVLLRLVDEYDAMRRIATKALEICHFDPETGEEFDKKTECAQACYHCLLTYSNQRDHRILNRHKVKDILKNISQGSTVQGYKEKTYDEQYEWLRLQTDKRSELEKKFLDKLYQQGRKLPDAAQKRLPNYYAQPDFYYDDGHVCVFCDGSVHDQPKQVAEDNNVRSALKNMGYRVVAIRYDRSLDEQIEANSDLFQKVK